MRTRRAGVNPHASTHLQLDNAMQEVKKKSIRPQLLRTAVQQNMTKSAAEVALRP
jgi:hypothetical protein